MINITRDTAHPWSGEPGWDRMAIQAETNARVPELIAAGQRKHWRLFFCSGKEVLMYKPAGAEAGWDDDEHWLGHDKEKARLLQPGDVVYTMYSGVVTRHKIIERQDKSVSGCGVTARVTPDVPRSGGGWMDLGWFRKVDFCMKHP